MFVAGAGSAASCFARWICVTDEEAASRAEPVGVVGSCARLAADPTVPRPKTAVALERCAHGINDGFWIPCPMASSEDVDSGIAESADLGGSAILGE